MRFAVTLHISSAGKSSAERIQRELTTVDSEADWHCSTPILMLLQQDEVTHLLFLLLIIFWSRLQEGVSVWAHFFVHANLGWTFLTTTVCGSLVGSSHWQWQVCSSVPYVCTLTYFTDVSSPKKQITCFSRKCSISDLVFIYTQTPLLQILMYYQGPGGLKLSKDFLTMQYESLVESHVMCCVSWVAGICL